MWRLLRKTNPSSRRKGGPISNRINGLRTNKNLVMGPYWARNQKQLCWLTAELLLALASTVILGSESHETHDRILLSDGRGSLQTDCWIAAGPRQHSYSWVRVPRDSWPYFTLWLLYKPSGTAPTVGPAEIYCSALDQWYSAWGTRAPGVLEDLLRVRKIKINILI
jgi:hypothetical protein